MILFGVPSVLLAVCVIFVPGVALGLSMGLRGRLLWGVAPALTLGFTGLAAISYSRFGIVWAPLSVAAGVAVSCVILVGITWILRKRWPGMYPHEPVRVGRLAVGLAIAAASAIAVTVMLVATDGLTRVSQGWDSLFHGTASRLIEQTGDASPFALASAAAPLDQNHYYPDAFHALTALLLHLPGQTMPGALNGMVAATSVVFILSAVALMQRIDPRPLALAAVAVLAASFVAFPALAAGHGPLSPFALGAAAMPGVLAAVFAILRRPGVPAVGAAALGASGIFVTHPSIALTMLILIAIIGLSWLAWGGRNRTRRSFLTLCTAGLGAALITFPSIDTAASDTMSGVNWPSAFTTPNAIRRALGFETFMKPQWLLAALAMLGLWAAVRRRELRPLVIGAGVFGFLFVITSSSDADYVQTLTSLWWNDKQRFLALYTLLMVPVAACGVVLLGDLGTRLGRRAPGWRKTHRNLVGIGLMLALTAVSALVYAPREVSMVKRNFGGGPTLMADERIALEEFARIYDAGAVMNNPYDGSPWLYTLESIPVLLPAPLKGEPTDWVKANGRDRIALYQGLDRLGEDSQIDAAVERLDVRWVIANEGVMGRGLAPGFAGLPENPRFEPMYANNDSVVYRVIR